MAAEFAPALALALPESFADGWSFSGWSLTGALPFFALAALAWILTYALHSTLLLVGAWAVTRRMSIARAAERERVWKFAVLAAFVTASLQVGLGFEPLGGRLPLERSEVASARAGEDRAADEGTAGAVDFREEVTRGLAESGDTQTRREDAFDAGASPNRASFGDASQDEPESRGTLARLIDGARGATAGLFARLDFLDALDPRAEPDRRPEPATNRPEANRPAALRAVSQLDAKSDPDESTPRGEDDLALGAAQPSSTGSPARSPLWAGVLGADWRSLAFGGCVLGALAGLFVFALLWVRLSGCLRGRVPLTHGPMVEKLAALRAKAGLERRVRLSVAPSLAAPISMGLLRPEICVPPRALLELSDEEQEALLAHELAHVVRRDPLWLAVCRLCEGVFFFQPLNRVARRELEDCAEFLSDAWAVRQTGLRYSLASCLTRIAEWIIGERRALPAPAMAQGRSRLRHRVELLLDESAGSIVERRPAWLAPACAGVGAALIAVLPCVSASVPAAPSGDPGGLDFLPTRESGFTVQPAVWRPGGPSAQPLDAALHLESGFAPACSDEAAGSSTGTGSDACSESGSETGVDCASSEAPVEDPAPEAPPDRDASTGDETRKGERVDLSAELDLLADDLRLLRAEAAGLDSRDPLARDLQGELASLEMKLAHLRELSSRLALLSDLSLRLRAALPTNTPSGSFPVAPNSLEIRR